MKERLLLAGLLFGSALSTHSVEKRDLSPSCHAIVVENGYMKGGLTVPLLRGYSVIFMRDTAVWNSRGFWSLDHELAHSQQICERGSLKFIKDYFADRVGFEKNADDRAREKYLKGQK